MTTDGRADGPTGRTKRLFPAIGLVAAACAGAGPARPVSPSAGPPVAAADTAQPIAPPAEAAAQGWMPLASTNVPEFAKAFPTFDGRGVLIAILDAGLDAGVLGPERTLDVRDFSGEGQVALAPVKLDRDRIRFGGVTLLGAGRIRGLQAGKRLWGGEIHEIDLGRPPAADLNGNGVVGDTLFVVLVRSTDSWALLADTDGDGSLDGERPIRDYLVGRESFGWHARGKLSQGSVAVNLEDRGSDQPPLVTLVYTVASHGTHVAGIAAGKSLYGVPGFDGVAPGASMLALKIAADARGSITTSGSMVRAMDYAIRYATAHSMPLVLNLSFGVGNEAEGHATIDALVDSILAANPSVVMTVSAGNDGPGLSTMGFPASARRPITVGATYPGAFLPAVNGSRADDLVAFFSARGGELALPDLVAPGIAYSSVPRFDTGDEIKNGTSMASPHVAGLVARLLSGLAAQRRSADAATIKRALMASSRPLAGGTWIDQGAGLPDLMRAWYQLSEPAPGPVVDVTAEHGVTASLQIGSPIDTTVSFTLKSRTRSAGKSTLYRLLPGADWLIAQPTIALADSARVGVRLKASALRPPGVYTGVIEGWGADSAWGPAFRLVTTVVKPHPLPADTARMRVRVAEGQLRRIPIQADSGRGIRFAIRDPRGAPLLAFLHEPGGMPWRGGSAQSAADTAKAIFELDGRDVVNGVYELVVMAGPSLGVDAVVEIDPAPARVSALRKKDTVWVRTEGLRASADARIRLSALWLGGERSIVTSARGGAEQRLGFHAPPWARRVVVELTMPRDQWPLFTDFGFTLLDRDGRQVAVSPVNYAVARLDTEIPAGADRPLTIVLSPGFADAGLSALWNARVAIRLYAAAPVTIGELFEGPLILHDPPFALPSGFYPLLDIITRLGDRAWHRETWLPDAPGPVMP